MLRKVTSRQDATVISVPTRGPPEVIGRKQGGPALLIVRGTDKFQGADNSLQMMFFSTKSDIVFNFLFENDFKLTNR